MIVKRIVLLFFTLLVVVPMANADVKIGYVSEARLVDESPQGEEVSKRLKKEFSGREKALVSKQNDLKKMQDRMQRDGAVMSAEEQNKLDSDIQMLQRDVQRKSNEFREDLNLRKNDEMKTLMGVIQAAIIEIGKEQNYDLIVYEGATAYASKGIDLTDKVLEKLRTSMKTTGASTTPKN